MSKRKLGTLQPYCMFMLGGSVVYMVLPTPKTKIEELKTVNVLELVRSGAERELSSSVEVEVVAMKNEVLLACSRLFHDAVEAL